MNASPISEDTFLTLQIDVLECGEDMGSDFKMSIALCMTAMVEDPSWCGLVSLDVEEQTCTRGMMTGARYRDDILAVCVRPYAGAIGSMFIIMDDNA